MNQTDETMRAVTVIVRDDSSAVRTQARVPVTLASLANVV